MPSDRKPLSSYRAPRYWPIWIGIGVLRLVCLLPLPLCLGIGRGMTRRAAADPEHGAAILNIRLMIR